MSDIPESSSARKRGNGNANAERRGEAKDRPNKQGVRLEDLTEEEKLAVVESLNNYCNHVEFYNFLMIRDEDKPRFLKRTLDYRIKAKKGKRLPVTISVTWNEDKTRTLFPFSVCLTRVNVNGPVRGELKYEVDQIVTFQSSSKLDEYGNTEVQAVFFIPKDPEQAKARKYYILILGSVENPISLSEVNSIQMPWDVVATECGETCIYQEISLVDLCESMAALRNVLSKQKIEIYYGNQLWPCMLKYYFRGKKKKCFTIDDCCDSQDERGFKQFEMTLSAKFQGMEKSDKQSKVVGSRSSLLSEIPWMKERNVSFIYRYYNNKFQQREVTEDFCCPFCLVKFPSFEALTCHLASSHDAFNFEFAPSKDHPSVYVSTKVTDFKLEDVGDGVDPRLQPFFFCSKRRKRREPKNVSLGRENDTDPMLLDDDTLAGDIELLENADGSNAIILHPGQDYAPPTSDHDYMELDVPQIDQEGVSKAIILHPGTVSVPPKSYHDHGTLAMPPVEEEPASNAIVPPISLQDHRTFKVPQGSRRRRKPIEHHESQMSKNASTSSGNCPPKLKQREFYHSHTYQAMALEEVLLDADSEDEINEYADEVEEKRKFALLDLSDHQRQLLFMWNTFIRKQHVRADGHMKWACECFTKHHCAELAQSPKLSWCWRLFMIKLWNHNLLDGRTFNQCSVILEEYKKQNSDISLKLKQIQF